MLSPSEMESLFDESVPYFFQKELTNIIFKCYSEATKARNEFGLRKAMGDWHLPLLRRAIIQSQAFELADRYGPSLRAEYRRTTDGGNEYLAIEAGQFVITFSKTDRPGQLPRDTGFRTTNSKVNYSLFAAEETTSDPLYVILTDVPKWNEPEPEWLGFIFPDAEYSTILSQIDLLQRFFTEVRQPVTEETPAVDPKPKLRPRADEAGGAQA